MDTVGKPSGTSGGAAGRLPAGGGPYDRVIRELSSRMQSLVDEVKPTMGTVVGRDRADGKGGKVLLHIDGEDDPRDVGVPRSVGVAFNPGDRVPVMANKGGDLVVLAPVTGSASDAAERGVDTPQLVQGAVDGHVLRTNTVTTDHLDNSLANKISSAASTNYVDNKVSGLATSREVDSAIARATKGVLTTDSSAWTGVQGDITALKRAVEKLAKKKDTSGK